MSVENLTVVYLVLEDFAGAGLVKKFERSGSGGVQFVAVVRVEHRRNLCVGVCVELLTVYTIYETIAKQRDCLHIHPQKNLFLIRKRLVFCSFKI